MPRTFYYYAFYKCHRIKQHKSPRVQALIKTGDVILVLGSGASQLTPFHYAFVFGFGVLCFYIGRADSMAERLEEQS